MFACVCVCEDYERGYKNMYRDKSIYMCVCVCVWIYSYIYISVK